MVQLMFCFFKYVYISDLSLHIWENAMGMFFIWGDGIRKNDNSERASEHPEVFLGQICMDPADGR